MVFENRVLRRMFGPNGKEVAGGWRKLRWGEYVTGMGEIRNAYKIL
jgi:hypothetical protein